MSGRHGQDPCDPRDPQGRRSPKACAATLLGRNHAAVVQILGSPLVAILMLLFVVTSVYHMRLGMQEIIVDYIHDELWKIVAVMANTFFCVVAGLACIYALLKLSFGL